MIVAQFVGDDCKSPYYYPRRFPTLRPALAAGVAQRMARIHVCDSENSARGDCPDARGCGSSTCSYSTSVSDCESRISRTLSEFSEYPASSWDFRNIPDPQILKDGKWGCKIKYNWGTANEIQNNMQNRRGTRNAPKTWSCHIPPPPKIIELS